MTRACRSLHNTNNTITRLGWVGMSRRVVVVVVVVVVAVVAAAVVVVSIRS